MLEGLLHHKKEIKQYFLALAITEDRIDGALWEKDGQGKVNIAATASENYTASDWETAIIAADKVISSLEPNVPEGVDLQKSVFGFFPEWVSEDKIKSEYLKKIKQLTSRLSLTPLGFVDIPQAVSMYLGSSEGSSQTVILIGFESKHYTMSLFKIGKLIGSYAFNRSENIVSDIEKALNKFADVEVLPSRMLLYGTAVDLEKIKADLLNYPWQTKANFLHFPKIEILPNDTVVKAVVIASSTEIALPVEKSEDMVESVADNTAVSASGVSDQGESQEVADIAQDLGFVGEEPVKDLNIENEMTEVEKQQNANIAPVTIPENKLSGKARSSFAGQIPSMPKFSFPKLTFTIKLPAFRKSGLIVLIIGLLILMAGGVYAFNWFYPQANVKLLVTPKSLLINEDVALDTASSTVDVDKKIIPGSEVKLEVTGTDKIITTGKKTVGDKARGEVTIYNKTANPKTLKKGTQIQTGNLKFTLDEDVSIASASENVGSLNYGSNKIAVTATDIGTSSNVGSGTEFSVADLPTGYYSGRNEKVFTGGTSREISVVARDDQKKLREQLLQKLQQQAGDEVKSKLENGKKLLDGSLTTQIAKETYNKEIGEETDSLSLDMSVGATALTYSQNDLDELLSKIVSAQSPVNYDYQKEKTKVSVTETLKPEGSKQMFKLQIEATLAPKVEIGDLANTITDKNCQDAISFIKNKFNIAGAECSINRSFFLFKDKLPTNPKNIQIEFSNL